MTDLETPRRSILGDIKARRQRIVEELYIDLPVPRWDEPVPIVRYRAVDYDYISKGLEKIRKAKGPQKSQTELNVNVDLLIEACIGIYAKINGTEYAYSETDPHGPWPTFGPELAVNLGLAEDMDAAQSVRARDVVKALYFTEGDILFATGEYMKWVGYADEETEREALGE